MTVETGSDFTDFHSRTKSVNRAIELVTSSLSHRHVMGDIRKVGGSGKSPFSTKGAKKDKDDLGGLERSGREKSL